LLLKFAKKKKDTQQAFGQQSLTVQRCSKRMKSVKTTAIFYLEVATPVERKQGGHVESMRARTCF
jgi:hypothetical protein